VSLFLRPFLDELVLGLLLLILRRVLLRWTGGRQTGRFVWQSPSCRDR
jgi:hypothetical protein